MGKPQFKRIELIRRRAVVAELYIRGSTQVRIAERLGVNPGQICRDLKYLHKQWQESSDAAFDKMRAVQLAKIDEIEREAWDAWTRSCEEREELKVQSKSGSDGGKEKTEELKAKTVKKYVGDPRFLERVAWCVETRLKMIGALSGENFSMTNLVQINWAEMYGEPEEYDPIEAKIAEASKTRKRVVSDET